MAFSKKAFRLIVDAEGLDQPGKWPGGFSGITIGIALVSLVFNRGTSMVEKPGEDRRKEMRAIRDAVPRQDLRAIADQLRSMKRLWVGKGLDGLIKRREAEAVLGTRDRF